MLLRKLAGSPLVRQTLPNTAAILQQYLSFKRRPGESMANFLVRETLGHEEFAEALQCLWEERNGIDPSELNFGLPPEEADEWDRWWGYGDDDYDGAASLHAAADEVEPAAAAEPQPAEGERSEDQRPSAVPDEVWASVGSSPSHGRGGPPSVHSASVQAFSTAGVNELSPTDSFIMGVLRGWRLLQAACLNAEETRDILSTTQNRLEFEAISKALQTLWDEQHLGQRYHHHPPSSGSYGHVYNASTWDDESWPSDSWDSSGYDDWWGEAQWQDEWHEDWWEDAAATEHDPSSLAPVEEEDEQLKEAHQAEQAAEQLAMEAKRTWAEAQRTTQQLRKDRGFGQHGSSAPGKCFTCGGNHFARDCPDRRVMPYSGKGGKNNHMISYDDPQQIYYMKGKGGKKGSKGKFKSAAMADQYAMWSSRNKGKGKSSGKPSRPPVNAYTAFYDLGGLEMHSQLRQ